MIPFPSTHATLPVGPASSASANSRESGATPSGQFAELFASMIPGAPVPGDSGAPVATGAEATDAEPANPENGQLAINTPEASLVGSQSPGNGAPAARTSNTSAADAEAVMNQRAQHPALSASAALPAGTAMVTISGNEQAASSTEPVSAERVAGSKEGSSLPVAVAPWLVVPSPRVVAPPEDAQLSAAEAPLLVLSFPEGGSPLQVASIPGTTVTGPAVADSGTAPTPSPQAPPVSAESEPTGANDALAPVAIATATPIADVVAAVPNAEIHGQVTAPDANSVHVQQEPDAGQTPADAATAPAGTQEVPAVSNAGFQPIPVVAGQGEARMAATGATASLGLSTDVGITAVEPLESSAVDTPVQRTQTPAPLHRQLLGPIASLAAGPNGERTLSVNIAPEALGPITVKAVLGGEGIRMELSAPTDAGREALRAMLPELRRELAATGSGTIMLSTGTDSSSTPGGHTGSQNAGGGDARSFTGAPAPGLRTRGEPAPETPGRETTLALHDTSHLDVMV